MPMAFIGAKGVIESYELPWITHIWRRSIAYILTFFHHILILFVAIGVMAVLSWQGMLENVLRFPDPVMMLYAIPGLFLVLIAGTGVGLLIAVVGARYRDLQPAMQVASSFLMLLSPVVWRADHLELHTWIVELNPVYYYLRVVRDPLLGLMPPAQVWIVASVMAAVLFVAGFLMFMVSRRRLYHWL
jgi:ABC-type polysaccharide/polyol phosphate export permease